MDLRDAAAYHLLTLNSEGAALETQRHYRFYWERLIEGFEALGVPLDPMNLTTHNVGNVLDWYRAGISKNTSRQGVVGVRVLALRAKTFSKFLEREGITPDDLLRKLKPPRVDKVLREPFTQAEVNAMWGACRQSQMPTRDEALFLLLLDTGMRIGEAAALKLDRLRLDQRQVIVGKGGKSRRERLVPIGDGSKRDGGRVLRALRHWLIDRPQRGLDEGRVFLSDQGAPISSDAAGQAIQRLGRAAGVSNPIPRRLRHTMATQYLVAFPGDEIGLRRVIGHTSHDVLADYVHFAQSIIAERTGRASLAENWLGRTPADAPPLDRLAREPNPRPRIDPPVKPAAPPQNGSAVVAEVTAPFKHSRREARGVPASAPRVDRDALIEAVRTDATLREELLCALLGDVRG